jgi:hypothetical protein
LHVLAPHALAECSRASPPGGMIDLRIATTDARSLVLT